MNNNESRHFMRLSLLAAVRWLAATLLICASSAQATAPRVAPGLFGEEKKSDIVGYQFFPLDAAAKADGELAVQLVAEAFKASGKMPTLDVLPSRQLARYALLNNDAVALIGGAQDVPAGDKQQFRITAFFLRPVALAEEAVALISSRKNVHAEELQQAFGEGLQKLIKSGRYQELLEKRYGKERVPADFAARLKRHNPGLK